MILKWMTLRAFRSFKDETTIHFPSSGLVLIRGKNTTTGESSGTGKSNIFVALAVALGFRPITSDECQSWLTAEPWNITVCFEGRDGKEIVICRGRRNFIKKEDRVVTGAEMMKEFLRKEFGLDTDMVEVLTYRAQDSKSLFLAKNDTEKKDFLCKVLGLDKYERAIKESDEKIKKYVADLDYVTMVAGRHTNRIEQLKESTPKVTIQTTDHLVELEKKLEAEIQIKNQDLATLISTSASATILKIKEKEVEERLKGLTAGLQSEIQALEKRKQDSSEYDLEISKLESDINLMKGTILTTKTQFSAAVEKFEEQRKNLVEGLEEIEDSKETIDLNKNKIARLQSELLTLKEKKCFTCNRSWEDNEEKVESIEEQIAYLNSEQEKNYKIVAFESDRKQVLDHFCSMHPSDDLLKRLEKREIEISTRLEGLISNRKQSVDTRLREILAQQQEKRNSISEMETAMEKNLAPFRQAVVVAEAQISEVKQKISSLTYELSAARTGVTSIEKQNQLTATILETHQKTITTAEAELSAAQADCKKFEDLIDLEEDFEALVGNKGFLNAIFSDVLAEIADQTNPRLAGMANVSHVTLRFLTEIDDGKTVKRAITPMVSVNGNEVLLKATPLSGGMMTSLSQAVDLSLISVIEQRSAISMGWICLDEVFNGQGSITKESCMDGLRQFAQQKLILVVDHSSEFQENFGTFIDVEFTNGVSRVL